VAARRPTRLTPKIQDLVATDRQSRPPVGRLTPAQVDQLKAVARRTRTFEVPVSAARALGALAAGARPAVAVPALKAVLSDGGAPQTDRIAAARGLGVVATPPAERALLAHLRVRDPRVQQDVFAALGLFGGPAAGRALGRLTPPSDHAARKQLGFAQALIAHRHGLDGPFLAEARPVERRPGRSAEMAAVTLRVAPARARAAAVDRLRGPTYEIEFAERAYSLSCGPAKWTIFLNREMGRTAASRTSLFDRPWIAGVLAQWLPTGEALTTRLVMLARPAGRQAHLDFVRADGEIVYTGAAQPAGSAIAFAVSDVERLGTAPLTITGRVTSTRVEVETAVVFAARVGVRETVATS
jgi:hypothetical protein